MRFSHVILSRNLSLFAGEVHANLGRFFYLEWRFPLGTYHLSKVLPMRWLEWGCCLKQDKQDSDTSYHIVSYRIVSYRIISSYRLTDIEDQFEASTLSPDSNARFQLFLCVSHT